MFGAYSKSARTGKRLGRLRRSGDPAAVASDYAATLLAALGSGHLELEVAAEPHPALAAAAAGLTALTGRADGPPVSPPGHLAACARGTVAALRALAGSAADPALAAIDGAVLLGERAAVLGLGRGGTTSVGGHCRLVRARDGWLAVNLPRAEDLATVPAWLESSTADDPWEAITAIAPTRGAGELVARARLLGLAAAEAVPPATTPPPWFRIAARGRRVESDARGRRVEPDPRVGRVPTHGDRHPLDSAALRPPLVLDLSTLWAGPLAAGLLVLAGARVVKLESTRRLDGARRGPASFFDLLNAGKESVALDFTNARDRRALVSLVARADIVIESARPRAMHQLGIDPAALVRARPGLTWISITGYGRGGRAGNWIGFGDDAATAAGFAEATGRAAGAATPLFCADALADPLTGLHAAVAALGAYRAGGGALVALALRDVAAHVLAFGPAAPRATVEQAATTTERTPTWEVVAGDTRQRVLPPRARTPYAPARSAGADTERILRELHVD